MPYAVFAVVHALASAAWFGSMFYSFSVLHPRAKQYFSDDSDFEAFIATLSQGARWKVLGAFAVVAASGLGLCLTHPPRSQHAWLALVVAKALLFLISLLVFCYTSWRLWPRRILATRAEVPALQRTFRRIAVTMITLIGASIVLGVLAHAV
jgi:uncharacterized membrane protein